MGSAVARAPLIALRAWRAFRAIAANAYVEADVLTRAWVLTKVADRLGNSMTIEYWKPVACPDGDPLSISYLNCRLLGGGVAEIYPKRIRYTAFESPTSSLPADRYVEFFYSPRIDKIRGYASGARYESTQLLHRIDAGVLSIGEDGEVTHRYELFYDDPDTPLGRSLLTSVRHCARKPLTGRPGAPRDRTS